MNHSPLVIYPDSTVTLPPRYCGDVGYYALMAQYGNAVIDFSMRYNKRDKACHRCEIEGANGVQRLTVPLEKGAGGPVAGLRVSDHGEWWNVHWGAIYSAYGRTPYFEYYADDFLPAFQGNIHSLMELDIMLDAIIRRILGITTRVTYNKLSSAFSGTSAPSVPSANFTPPPQPSQPTPPSQQLRLSPPCREARGAGEAREARVELTPYYQVWSSRFGFIPGLSILDLIFNMGTESPLHLR